MTQRSIALTLITALCALAAIAAQPEVVPLGADSAAQGAQELVALVSGLTTDDTVRR